MLQITTSSSSLPSFPGVGLTMSSREIAEITQKQHSHVMRDIESMLKQLDEVCEGYLHFWTHPQNGRQYREFRLDREHTECLIAGYSAPVRMKIIRRWHALESRNGMTVPKTLPEALRLAADMAEQNEKLAQKVQQDAPKVAFVERYVEAGRSKSLREVAKILNMPEKAMTDALVRDRVLFRQSGSLLPYALRQQKGLFEVKTGISPSGYAFSQTRVTPKGLAWLAARYGSEKAGG